MKRADIAILPAGQFSRAALTALWNQAYEGYFVPVAFDEQRFARHLRRADVELGLSRVLTAGGEPAGLSLVGQREARAYLAGFGIVRAQRRRGLARLLMEVQLAALPAAGVREVVLEVIEQNPARILYGHAGFEALRPLELLSGTLDGQAAEPVALSPADLADVHARCSAIALPTWRRELPTLLDALRRRTQTRSACGAATPSWATPCCPSRPATTAPCSMPRRWTRRPRIRSWTCSRPRAPAPAGAWSTSPAAAPSSARRVRAAWFR
jgi:GNAT superfamily N-acetyltransferase